MEYLEIVKKWLGIQSAVLKVVEQKEAEKPIEKPETLSEKLYRIAKAELGKKHSPQNPTLGCAEAVNNIHRLAFGEPIGGGASTWLLWKALESRDDFELITNYEVGAIIISPTGMGSGTIENGHVGICGKWQIMSNNSSNGLWDTHFTKEKWEEYFQRKGGYPIFYFRKKVAKV